MEPNSPDPYTQYTQIVPSPLDSRGDLKLEQFWLPFEPQRNEDQAPKRDMEFRSPDQYLLGFLEPSPFREDLRKLERLNDHEVTKLEQIERALKRDMDQNALVPNSVRSNPIRLSCGDPQEESLSRKPDWRNESNGVSKRVFHEDPETDGPDLKRRRYSPSFVSNHFGIDPAGPISLAPMVPILPALDWSLLTPAQMGSNSASYANDPVSNKRPLLAPRAPTRFLSERSFSSCVPGAGSLARRLGLEEDDDYPQQTFEESHDELSELYQYVQDTSRFSPPPVLTWIQTVPLASLPEYTGPDFDHLVANDNSLATPLVEDIEEQIAFEDVEPFDTRGHFCDLFLGTHRRAGKVALKRLRHRGGGVEDDETLIRHFKRETTIWMGLRHERILQCLGTFQRGGHFYFVSMFMKNGTLFDWIRSGEHVGSDRLRLIHELSEALLYLHSSSIVHGDVKANNVLLSDDLHVQLCDFGLTKLAESSTTTTLKGAGSVRWQSPELWNNEPKTLSSDVYAFSMTIVEVLTSRLPFAKIIIDTAVIKAVLVAGERPVRIPESSPDGTTYVCAWDTAERCWSEDPGRRISMGTASELLRIALR